VDDLIAAAIGGVVNLGVNLVQGNLKGKNVWESIGKGFAAFGAGAVAGDLALYGPAGWAGGGAIVGGTNAWLGGENIIQGTAVGAFSGLVGGAAGQLGSKFGGVIINGMHITSPVLQGTVGGVAGGAVGGYVGGFTSGLIMTGDIGEANKAGWKGAVSGASIGGITGSVSAYKYAKQNNINPWTGKSTDYKGIGTLMEETVAAKEGANAITQFSGSTIDDAVSLVMKDPNKLNHLFPAKHNLGDLVNQLGGQEHTIRTVLNAANGKLPASGVFNNIPVTVGGQMVFIRGNVINGVPRLGTMYIP
jgi:hypothetical protein